jgi:GT2 family glycosyltransferase
VPTPGDAGVPAPGGDAAPAASVDVVIVSADMAEMTLACVAELNSPAVASVVVVDNAFDGEQRDERAELARRATIAPLDRPSGFAAANNRGVALGEAPYVLLLNSDVLVVDDAIEGLLQSLGERPTAVAAGGRLVDPDTLATQEQYRPRPFPTLANFLVIVLGVEELWPANPITRRYHGAALDEHTVQSVAQPAAAALLVRRDALDRVGGFDERFWFWFEDSDLLLRLSALGEILYAPRSVFRHLGGGTFRRWSKANRIRSVHHGIVQYADAHFSRPKRAVLGLALLAVSVPRIALFGRSRPDEASAWRAVARAGGALFGGRHPAPIAPGPDAG